MSGVTVLAVRDGDQSPVPADVRRLGVLPVRVDRHWLGSRLDDEYLAALVRRASDDGLPGGGEG